MMDRFRHWTHILYIGFVFPALLYAADDATIHRLRDEDLPPGIYFAPAIYDSTDGKTERRLDTTNGIKLSSLNEEDFQKAIGDLENLDGVIVAVGVPFLSRASTKTRDQIRVALDKKGLQSVPVHVITRPHGYGIARIVREALYLLPGPSSLQSPVKSEFKGGLTGLAASQLTLLGFAIVKYPKEILLPMMIGSTSLNFIFVFYRRSLSNWINLSTGRGHEKFLKEAIPSVMFSGIYFASFHWQEWMTEIQKEKWSFFGQLPQLTLQFFKENTFTSLLHAGFFTTTFAGIYLWDQLKSQTVEGSDEARKTMPYLIAALMSASTPLLAIASSESPLVHLNAGHIGLALLTALGAFAWQKPTIFDHVPKFLKCMRHLVNVGRNQNSKD